MYLLPFNVQNNVTYYRSVCKLMLLITIQCTNLSSYNTLFAVVPYFPWGTHTDPCDRVTGRSPTVTNTATLTSPVTLSTHCNRQMLILNS